SSLSDSRDAGDGSHGRRLGGYGDSDPPRPRRSWSLYRARVFGAPRNNGRRRGHRCRPARAGPLALECERAQIAERGMSPPTVVEPLEVLEHLTPRLRAGGPERVVRQFDL